MPLLDWDEKYSVGDPMMDTQHKKWIGYINELYDAVKEKRGEAEQAEILENVVIYTRYHFASEERLLKRIDYPSLDEHHQIHERMTQKAIAMQKEVNAGQADRCLELIELLRTWLVDHILTEDKKYSEFVVVKSKREAVLVG